MTKLFKLILIFILVVNISYSELLVKNITTNSAEIKIEKSKEVSEIALFLTKEHKVINSKTKLPRSKESKISLKNALEIDDGVFLLYLSNIYKELELVDLYPRTKYYLTLIDVKNHKAIDSLIFYTLSQEPKSQAKYIVFKNMNHKETGILFKKGDGQKRVVLVSTVNDMSLPKDGKFYKANTTFGSFESAVGKNTYCVYNGNGFETKVTGLEGETHYYYRVFEYNGEGQTCNYLHSKENQNPREKLTPLAPPKALPAEEITQDGFLARWTKVKGAIFYELDIASDKNFMNIVEPYNHMDVGKIDGMMAIELEPGAYYYRVRAVSKKSRSEFSDIMKVVLKKDVK